MKTMEEAFDILLPKSEATKLVRLTKELVLWVNADETGPSKEMVREVAEILWSIQSHDMAGNQSNRDAHRLLKAVPLEEKQRITNEIKAIHIEHRRIPYNPALMEKTARLLDLHYGLSLEEDQLVQVMQFIARKLWTEEGLNASLEKCLDDLIAYADKRKRHQAVSLLNVHDEVRKGLDLIVQKLTSKEIDPLYRK